MPYTFQVVFHGLCAFVPDRPIDAFDANGNLPNPPREMTVLLRDLRNPPNNGNGSILVHHAFVEFSERDRITSASDREVDGVFRPGQLNERRICMIRKEDVSVFQGQQEPSQGALQVVNRRPANLQQPTAQGDEDLLFWLAKIGPDTKTPGLAHGGLRNAVPNVAGVDLAGRIHLKTGRLRTFALSNRVFQFQGGARKRLATKVALEFANVADDQTFTLSFKGFGAAARKSLVFGRRPGAGSPSVVRVDIKNREIDEFFGVAEANDLDDGSEFGIFYDLLAATVPLAQRVIPRPTAPILGAVVPRGALRTLCPPTGMEG